MTTFQRLSFKDQERERQWAREHYKPFSPIDGTWHPIRQFEAVRINAEIGYPADHGRRTTAQVNYHNQTTETTRHEMRLLWQAGAQAHGDGMDRERADIVP